MSTIEAERRGLFISFEGLDGSGKTTQLERLAERLCRLGHEVVMAVEPGGTRIGEQIRRILLDSSNQDMAGPAEMLLYFASRAQNVREVIAPALARGLTVLADRFTDSTLAYQGYGRGLGEEAVRQLHRIACGDLTPDLTLLLDIDLDTSLARARERGRSNRMDEQAAAFYRRVRQGYLEMAAREPHRYRVIDGRPAPEVVASAVWEAVRPFVEH